MVSRPAAPSGRGRGIAPQPQPLPAYSAAGPPPLTWATMATTPAAPAAPHTPHMPPRGRRLLHWLAAALGALVLLAVAAWAALVAWLPSDEELAQRFVNEAGQRLGVPVAIDALRWQILPLPVVTLANARTGQPSPISAQRIAIYPELAPLLQRRVVVREVVVDGARVPQLSLRDLRLLPADGAREPGAFSLQRLVLNDMAWVQRNGLALPLAGEILFDARNIPRRVELARTGFTPETRVVLTRRSPAVADGQTPEDWGVQLAVGGGRADGGFRLTHRGGGRITLAGELAPRRVEVNDGLASMGRRSPVAGHASGATTLAADAEGYGRLLRTLQTTTRFEMADAVLLKFDLDRAVRSAGKEHAGQTRLDSLTGTLHTENTPQGIVARYSDLKGSSGAFTATGQATLAHRQINADVAVDLVDGLVGVPLKVTGPYDALQVSVPGGTVAGAVVGTAVLPGVGTAIGARIGATLGRIFGGPEPVPPKRARPASRPAAEASAPPRRGG